MVSATKVDVTVGAVAVGNDNSTSHHGVPSPVSATSRSEPSSRLSGSDAYTVSSVPNPFAAVTTASANAPQPVSGAPWSPDSAAPAGGTGPAPSPAAVHPKLHHQDYPHPAPHYSHPPHGTHQHHHPGPLPRIVSTLAATSPGPAPPTTYYHHRLPAHHQHSNPTVSAGATTAWTRENSCPNFSIGSNSESTSKSKSTAPRKGATNKDTRRKSTQNDRRNKTSTPSLCSKHSTSSASLEDDMDQVTAEGATAGVGVGDSVNSRRQKRLERNRESARLSRRRRKQYLEILEERVTQLSTEVDQGRRAHAAHAIVVTMNKRREILEAAGSNGEKSEEERTRLLDHGLRRTSAEMMLVATFKVQQLKSFSLPPQSKFILWLTLQTDQYFRGGRAASERLSAARIGERMLNSGNDRVPPANSMWPLFCNEVGLSYDQEERVRGFQRTLLQSHDCWLERHAARAADLVMASAHDSTQAISLRLGQKERFMLNILSPSQRIRFLSWAEKKRENLKDAINKKTKKHWEANKSISPIVDDRFKTDKRHHVAANLYVLNHRLLKVLQTIPRAAPLVTGPMLMKLSRRPSFESLGRSPMEKTGLDGEEEMSREHSFASSGSLKRSASAISMDGDRPQLLQISPDDAEESSKGTIEKVLGHLQEIIPPTPKPQYSSYQYSQARIPSPAHVSSCYYHNVMVQPQSQQIEHAVHQLPVAQEAAPMSGVSSPQPAVTGHRKQSSFIPPYLNVVPEEMFPNDGTADDFLMSLVDEDWAIGEGIDMDATSSQ